MYYEINVAKNGRHYFATAERSLQSEEQAKEMYKQFCKLFPKAEGYIISLSQHMRTAKYICTNENE